MWLKRNGAYLYVDERGGGEEVSITRVVDLAPFFDANKELRQLQGKGNLKGSWRLKARIPLDMLMALPLEERLAILSDAKALDKFIEKHPELKVVEGG